MAQEETARESARSTLIAMRAEARVQGDPRLNPSGHLHRERVEALTVAIDALAAAAPSGGADGREQAIERALARFVFPGVPVPRGAMTRAIEAALDGRWEDLPAKTRVEVPGANSLAELLEEQRAVSRRAIDALRAVAEGQPAPHTFARETLRQMYRSAPAHSWPPATDAAPAPVGEREALAAKLSELHDYLCDGFSEFGHAATVAEAKRAIEQPPATAVGEQAGEAAAHEYELAANAKLARLRERVEADLAEAIVAADDESLTPGERRSARTIARTCRLVLSRFDELPATPDRETGEGEAEPCSHLVAEYKRARAQGEPPSGWYCRDCGVPYALPGAVPPDDGQCSCVDVTSGHRCIRRCANGRDYHGGGCWFVPEGTDPRSSALNARWASRTHRRIARA